MIKEASVKHLLKEVQENLFKAYENQYCDLDHLLKSSYDGTGIMDLTPVSISMNTLHREEFIDYISNSPKNQLSVCINKKDSQTYDLSFIYNAELYDKETLTLFGERFIRIVNEIVRDLDQTIKQIEVITEEEKVELLQHYNHTFVEYPSKNGSGIVRSAGREDSSKYRSQLRKSSINISRTK